MSSLHIERNVPLAPYTTLGIGGRAHYFATIERIDALKEALQFARDNGIRTFVLGGGSNVLFGDEGFDGLVLRMAIEGITYEALGDVVHVTVGAGVMLDTFIAEVVARGFWGLENLSAIPGTVGATPVQNVGAYGVEVKDHIQSVYVYDMHDGAVKTLANAACEFGYRDSLFKREEGKRYIILSVTFVLSQVPQRNIAYKDLAQYFGDEELPSLVDIRNAIIKVRSNKFPDWHVCGTAGSFFKNPIIDQAAYEELKKHYPGIPGFPHGAGMVKVPLGWILEHVLKKKGYREGNVGLFEKQALVLVNHGGASAHEVAIFSQTIIDEVYVCTGIRVEREVVRVK